MTKFNEMIEAQRAYAEQILWQVQLREWPDSVRVSVSEAMLWCADQPQYLDQLKKEFFEDYADLQVEPQIIFTMWDHNRQKLIAQHRAQIAGSLSLCLHHPHGVFYECGPNRQWRGFRYGTEGSQYISGFGRV